MIGEKLGRYTILEEIGSGSMGVVYRAEDCLNGNPVAIKVVRANVLYDSSRRERFLQCMLAASEIRHPGICPILEIGDEEDDFYVVTPFLEGSTLEHIIRHHLPSPALALKYAAAAGEALQAVHVAGFIHRAFKPANVRIQPDGSIILTDCGLARFTEIDSGDKHRARINRIDCADTIIPMSALAYMSPEQIRGDALDHRSDIFSFGIVVFEMLAGRHPFEARNSLARMSAILDADPVFPALRRASLPKGTEAVVCKALSKNPADRYSSMDQMLACLRQLQDGGSAPFDSILQTDPAKMSPGRRHRSLIVGAALLALASVCSYLYYGC
jgi:eukaryotic-like serine/threonine-protein kinase